MGKCFLSGNEAFAYGICLARPQVISAYPITPQTIVVEKLSELVEDGSLKAEFIHVESEHSALSCAIGASAVGARTFTATSSQGLLYMAECLTYASGGRFPIVMMNANRSTALPWNIYGDQRDSLSQLDCGWIQAYAENAQESLDLALMSYYVAEHREVSAPFMANLDGFVLTHTYEVVEVPAKEQADSFLPPFVTENKMDFGHPRNLAFSAGPEHNTAFKYKEHIGLLNAKKVIAEAEEKFARIFGRQYTGLIESYRTEDADYILITLGSIAGLVKEKVDKLRAEGKRVGLIRLRYIRPFPNEELAGALKNAKAIAVLEKDVSFGNEGTVFTNVNSALHKAGISIASSNYIGGLGGKNISEADIEKIFEELKEEKTTIQFLGLGGAEKWVYPQGL
ncbi:pyruvate ferredoxin oxidoreductase alpha subunit [Ruminiclostridium sufflavum DSM 19573]|uniref:Pyruvate ferredoxin oxidoreductase alpha subunit n=1 Tax=Ruminiclostridium sufflavum DSM 19573 TaxID=1121337 RepID=A0A318XSV4_9FIRM|nr:pyruvate ferredoxin oxidoreductase [Ruminiclostridium sufflavum]PYG89451.1 pyruvate ferredoxin oxidoreductase alpha subunit [Ruminiclostridium sufflavum DSM 19573]